QPSDRAGLPTARGEISHSPLPGINQSSHRKERSNAAIRLAIPTNNLNAKRAGSFFKGTLRGAEPPS
ncbi:MAG TPA: hypothetical protein PLO92_04440, partial [Anaerolineaceae bacterium]|nr:hypothetical protein [Anaerolineaceae bacterium]